MANRYLRATGNWNGAVWASTSGGTAGSAATPTASDYVYINANFTVTLTANATCMGIFHENGQIKLSSYKLTVEGDFQSYGSNPRTLNLDSGTLELNMGGISSLYLAGTNLTLNAGSSLIDVNYSSGATDLTLGNYMFNDFRLSLNKTYTENRLSGSPTFRSLIIQSKNSAAHTVIFDDGADITVDKFIAIGSSASNKMYIDSSSGSTSFILTFNTGGSCYGQYLIMAEKALNTPNGVPLYIGSQSEDQAFGGNGWLLQDPPKISTLVDPLTTAPGSNSNWTVAGTITQKTTGGGGGGYELYAGNFPPATVASMVSTDTFDVVDSTFIFESLGLTSGAFYSGVVVTLGLVDGTDYTAYNTPVSGVCGGSSGSGDSPGLSVYTYPSTVAGSAAVIGGVRFFKVSVSSSASTMTISVLDVGGTVLDSQAVPITETDLLILRSTRIYAAVKLPSLPDADAAYTIGSINPVIGSTGNMLMMFN